MRSWVELRRGQYVVLAKQDVLKEDAKLEKGVCPKISLA